MGLIDGDGGAMDQFEIDQTMEDADADGNSTIDKEEFINFMLDQVRSRPGPVRPGCANAVQSCTWTVRTRRPKQHGEQCAV